MAKLACRPQIELLVTFAISEGEARFLDALIGYGGPALIEVVKKHLGEHYIRDHEEDGLKFCETVREQLPSILQKLDTARNVFEKR